MARHVQAPAAQMRADGQTRQGRGKVIPVADLRLKFGMPPAAYSQRACMEEMACISRTAAQRQPGESQDTMSAF
ncbi:MAG: hypothetical protein V1806_08960 [Pseudomonadota bacterium]